MAEPVRVAIVLVTYNSAADITACLDAALAQRGPDLALEVVVVDNASTDGTVDLLARYGDSIRVLPQERNLGFAEGMNLAFEATGSDLVLFLNPDVVMRNGCVQELVAHLSADPGCAGAAALLHDIDGSLQRFARREVDLGTVAWSFTALGRRLDRRRGGERLRRRTYEEEWAAGIVRPLAVDCPAAACLLARRELLEPRPFDPALPLFFNDAELYRRLRGAGFALEVVPTARALHLYGTSVRAIDRSRMRAEWVAATRRYLRPVLPPGGRATLFGLFLADALSAAALQALGRAEDNPTDDWRGTLGGLGLPGGARPWLTQTGRRAVA
jgi:hypothetical protein